MFVLKGVLIEPAGGFFMFPPKRTPQGPQSPLEYIIFMPSKKTTSFEKQNTSESFEAEL